MADIVTQLQDSVNEINGMFYNCTGMLQRDAKPAGTTADGELSDALPDRLVVPSGLPLVLLTAIRVACYPKAFHLDAPTAVDELANRSFCALFESSWPSTTTHGRSIHVIDLVVKSAVKEAEKRIRAHLLAQEGSAKATAEVTHQILLKHLRFFQRVGQQALNAILGPSLLLTGRTEPAKGETFGDARRAFDPFLSAMAQHARRTASGTASAPSRVEKTERTSQVRNRSAASGGGDLCGERPRRRADVASTKAP